MGNDRHYGFHRGEGFVMTRDPIAELERARSALWSLDAGCDADTHFRHAAGAADAGIDFDEFHSWSATGSNYTNEADCRSTWKSASKPGAITKASLFRAALANGWTDGTVARPERPQSRQKERQQAEPTKPPLHDPATLWNACQPATADHEYIERKKGLPNVRRLRDALTKTD